MLVLLVSYFSGKIISSAITKVPQLNPTSPNPKPTSLV